MSKQDSLATCLARMYEGNSRDSQGKNRAVVQVKKSAGAGQGGGSNNLSVMDNKLSLLHEKVDQIVNFQGQVLKKLEDMSHGMGELEKNIENLKTFKGTDGVEEGKDNDTKCSQDAGRLDQAEMFVELLRLVTSVHQDTAKQSAKLDGMEKMLSAVDKVIHFVGETFKNSKIVEFILKGIVPWKKESLIESEAKDKVEETGARPKHGLTAEVVNHKKAEQFPKMGVAVKTLHLMEMSRSSKMRVRLQMISFIKTQATYHHERETSHHQLLETVAKEKELRQSNESDGTSRNDVPTETTRAEEVPGQNQESTQSQTVKKDIPPKIVEVSQSNETKQDHSIAGSLCSQRKETENIILTVMSGAPEAILAATQSKSDGSCTLLLQRTSAISSGAQGISLSGTDRTYPMVITSKEFHEATLKTLTTVGEGVKELHKKCKEQQQCTSDAKSSAVGKTAREKAPIAATGKQAKASQCQQKRPTVVKTHKDQKSEKNTLDVKHITEKACKSGNAAKDSEEPQEAIKEPENIIEVKGSPEGESNSTEITNKAKSLEVIKVTEDIIIDDSPSPPAPFNHRIVTAKQVNVGSSYTVHHNELLGGGRFGEVHKCAETATGLTLAAKIVKVKSLKEREEVKNEINVMNQLNHINLIQLYDAFEAKNNVTLIMEYVGGGELFDRIIDEHYNLTELDTIIFVKQICEGVFYLHQQYVLHLDLKPENILCVNNSGNQIKIIDFGLARRYKPKEKLKVNFGTPEFLAPEVVNYDYVSFPTDMWSVGVITYMLLSGLSPFLGEHDTETLNNIISGSWDFDAEAFENVSEEAKEFVSKLLIKEKSARSSAAQCLKHSWLNNLQEKAKNCRVRLKSQVLLQKYIAQRMWRKNFYAIAAANRFRKFHEKTPTSPI
ncbi:LOW QUALITY PROTEIN: myosin light chain kinase 3 [Callorhinchus milii]|uniref:LOW QUALITY PROTEIN: myosin light chain kinase 3 n=1 Tax=Callorhinchus milii TaxID=7868 RepID=UPI001C3FC0F7|nr:LOW QUALITY PROTEIN: myosin light chain kinase 3 [Callorhinchus milii]